MSTRRKNFTNKRSCPDWKESPSKPFNAAAKRRRREWLIAHRTYLSQLLFSEAER